MWLLVYKELVQLKSFLLQLFGILIVLVFVLGRMSTGFTKVYLLALSVTIAISLPQLSFANEERGNTFIFLRALPVRPVEIVAAKYVVSFLVTLC